MGTLNQCRGVFYLGLWERAVPLADILPVFPWRITIPTDPALAGFAVMLILLLVLAMLRSPRPPGLRAPKVYFAPIGLCAVVAVLMLVFLNVEAFLLYSALWRGDAFSRTEQLYGPDYRLVPKVQSTELTENQDLQVKAVLVREASYGDEEVVRRYVYGSPYRRFFDFRLVFPLVFDGIKSVTIGSCQPTPLGVQEIYSLRALGGWALAYDLAPCFNELDHEGFPIPVTVVFDKDISVQDPADRMVALATFIPSIDYLSERAWLVNALAVVSLGLSAGFLIVVGILLRG